MSKRQTNKKTQRKTQRKARPKAGPDATPTRKKKPAKTSSKRAGYPKDPDKRPRKKNAKRPPSKAASKKTTTRKSQRRAAARKRYADESPREATPDRMPSEAQLARTLITGKPVKRKNIRPGRGDAAGPFKKPELRVFTTTLWDYPSQHYGNAVQGDKNFVGATPSWVVWQLIQRYTNIGGRVVDPMAGSGTTIDVARDTGREARAFDLAPTRDDIQQADARNLPLDDNLADLVFIDPPYSTHIDYSDAPECIGKLDAADAPPRGKPLNDYHHAMARVFDEALRILKPKGVIAVYASDSWSKKHGFTPIGVNLFNLLAERADAIEHIAVARRNEKLERGNYHKSAEEQNFFLRGFNHLLIFRKPPRTRRPAAAPQKGRPRTAPDKPSRPAGTGSRPAQRVGGRASYQHKNTPKRPPHDTGADPPAKRKRKPADRSAKSPLGPRRSNKPNDRNKPGSL
jgi:DNA modification methylase